jgi:hypothetical protein
MYWYDREMAEVTISENKKSHVKERNDIGTKLLQDNSSMKEQKRLYTK